MSAWASEWVVEESIESLSEWANKRVNESVIE